MDTHLSFVVSHRTPLSRCENALFGRFSLITENLLDQLGIRTYALEEHEVRAEGFPRRVWVLHVRFSGPAGLALGGPEGILSFDVFGSEGAHVSRIFLLPSVFGSLRHALVFLGTIGGRGQRSENPRLDKERTSFSAALRFAYS